MTLWSTAKVALLAFGGSLRRRFDTHWQDQPTATVTGTRRRISCTGVAAAPNIFSRSIDETLSCTRRSRRLG
jgi:hypothetical protein